MKQCKHQYRTIKGLLFWGLLFGAWQQAVAQSVTELRIGDLRTTGAGLWGESWVWEQWNGKGWIPLLPGEFPGSRTLLEARVVIEHHVVIPAGQTIYLESVSAERGENLQVDGELIVGKREADGMHEPITTGASREAQAGFGIASVYPNPVVGRQGNQTRVVIEVLQGKRYDKVTLLLADESGQVIRHMDALREVMAGRYEIQIEVGDIPSGNYLLVAEADGVRRSRQIVVVQ